ncbi:MAG: DUF1653 domain-containing protein [Bacteroidia bacterium]|nr:DUF1653 domain-containing protein [Bacteroidia bacterium]
MIKESRYFQHFKGGKYELLAFGKDSENMNDVVIYKALYDDGQIWVRPKDMFFANVRKNGIETPRFREITEEEAYGKN